MKCLKCGNLLKKTDEFCSRCGKKLKEEKSLIKIFSITKEKTVNLMDFYPFGISGVLEKNEVVIPSIVVDVCGSGIINPAKFFLYAGYFIRKAEVDVLKRKISKNIVKDKEIQKLINSEDKLASLLKKIADHLDKTDILGLGSYIEPYLFLEKNKLHLVFDEIRDELLKGKTIESFYYADKNSEEIFLRNIFFGYCLRVSFEITNLLAENLIKTIAKNPEKYGYFSH